VTLDSQIRLKLETGQYLEQVSSVSVDMNDIVLHGEYRLQLLIKFCEMTGYSPTLAHLHLDWAEWNLERALERWRNT
jgi:UBA-like domain